MKNKALIAASSAALLLALAGCGSTGSSTSAPEQSGQSSQSQPKDSTKQGSKTSTDPSDSNKGTSSNPSQSGQDGSGNGAASAFDTLSVSQRNQLFANWLANTQGAFRVYNVDAATTIFINDGSNGAKAYSDGQFQGSAGVSLREEANSAKFVIAKDSVSLYTPAGETGGAGYSGNWKTLTWKLQETKTKAELMKISQSNQQIFQTNSGSPE